MKKVTDLKENKCIHCTTKEEFKAILKLNPENNVEVDSWKYYKEETVYYPFYRNGKGGYGSLNFAQRRNCPIHPASDFLQPTYQLTKEQLIEIAENGSLVKELFPDVFEVKLEAGKWYKHYLDFYKANVLFLFNGKYETKSNGKSYPCGIGFNTDGKYCDDEKGWTNLTNIEPATAQEVETALVNEAKRRYTNEKVLAFNLDLMCGNPKSVKLDLKKSHLDSNNRLWVNAGEYNAIVFKNGKWAEIIQTPIEVIKLIEVHGKDKLITLIEAYDNRNSK